MSPHSIVVIIANYCSEYYYYYYVAVVVVVVVVEVVVVVVVGEVAIRTLTLLLRMQKVPGPNAVADSSEPKCFKGRDVFFPRLF